jgi:hypothetical protein
VKENKKKFQIFTNIQNELIIGQTCVEVALVQWYSNDLSSTRVSIWYIEAMLSRDRQTCY